MKSLGCCLVLVVLLVACGASSEPDGAMMTTSNEQAVDDAGADSAPVNPSEGTGGSSAKPVATGGSAGAAGRAGVGGSAGAGGGSAGASAAGGTSGVAGRAGVGGSAGASAAGGTSGVAGRAGVGGGTQGVGGVTSYDAGVLIHDAAPGPVVDSGLHADFLNCSPDSTTYSFGDQCERLTPYAASWNCVTSEQMSLALNSGTLSSGATALASNGQTCELWGGHGTASGWSVRICCPK